MQFRRAREGELPRSGKRGWPGPRPRRATLGHNSARHPVGARIARPMASPVLEVATIFFRMLTINVRARTASGRSVAFMETTGEGLTSPAPPPPGSGSKTSRRDVIANQIFPQYVDKFVCGRGHPRTSPAGVIRKRGRSAPSCARGGRAGREYAVRNSSVANPRQRNHRTFYAKNPFACPASATAHANPAQNARSAVRY